MACTFADAYVQVASTLYIKKLDSLPVHVWRYWSKARKSANKTTRTKTYLIASSCFASGYFWKNFFIYASSGRLICLTLPSERGNTAGGALGIEMKQVNVELYELPNSKICEELLTEYNEHWGKKIISWIPNRKKEWTVKRYHPDRLNQETEAHILLLELNRPDLNLTADLIFFFFG